VRVIEVLGPGCRNCQAVEANVQEALASTGQEAEVRHITDWAEIASRGVMSTPGLIIDGTLVSSGRIPSVDQVASWLVSGLRLPA
jgi:small redox-active disulfide protein 2